MLGAFKSDTVLFLFSGLGHQNTFPRLISTNLGPRDVILESMEGQALLGQALATEPIVYPALCTRRTRGTEGIPKGYLVVHSGTWGLPRGYPRDTLWDTPVRAHVQLRGYPGGTDGS